MTRPTVVLATRNPGKLVELVRILSPYDVALVSLDDLPPYEPAAETGATFAENALAKAHEAARETGLCALADDSGLCVDALGGMPGVLSARWSGRHGDDAANLELVLGQLADVPAERRGAHFVCVAAAALPDGRELAVEADVRGRLAQMPRGSGGFGYDPVFVPDDHQGHHDRPRTMAELSPQEKEAISHRGRAFRILAPRLADLLA